MAKYLCQFSCTAFISTKQTSPSYINVMFAVCWWIWHSRVFHLFFYLFYFFLFWSCLQYRDVESSLPLLGCFGCKRLILGLLPESFTNLLFTDNFWVGILLVLHKGQFNLAHHALICYSCSKHSSELNFIKFVFTTNSYLSDVEKFIKKKIVLW